MKWRLHCGDLLDVSADILVCPANVYLTLSGGVGGAFLLRYGDAMQRALQEILRTREIRHVFQGDVISMSGFGSPYQNVLHAVAVDAFYASSSKIIEELVSECLTEAIRLDAKRVALAALGTGYGRLTMLDFAEAIKPLLDRSYAPLESVTIGLRSRHDAGELMALLPALEEVVTSNHSKRW